MVSEQTFTDMQSHDAPHHDETFGATNEQERAAHLVERAMADIADIEERVIRETGAERGSAELVAATDEALIYIAKTSNASHEISGPTAHDAAMDAVIEGALEASHLKSSNHENPAATLDHDAQMHVSITNIVRELHDTHATLSDGTDAAEAAVRAIESQPVMSDGRGLEYVQTSAGRDALRDEPQRDHEFATRDIQLISAGWSYENGTLTERPYRAMERNADAIRVLEQSEHINNEGLAVAVGSAVETVRLARASENSKLQAEIDHISVLIESRRQAGKEVPPPMQAAKDGMLAQMGQDADVLRNTTVTAAVRQELADQERTLLEAKIGERVQADSLPWTMPSQYLPPELMDGIKTTYESILAGQTEPSDDDQIKVAPPMENFEGARSYTPEDEALLTAAGIDLDNRDNSVQHLHFTREELKRANIFFINRLGGGEQPIFGMPIPDPQSENGVFNVQNRSFLTEEEFKKVYEYQQANGYGLEGKDAKDVQTDMIMYAVRPESRSSSIPRKRGGFSTREDKYNVARSPFVDSGFSLKHGVETYAPMPDGTSQRINTMTIHMVGHEKYPGTSEMFDPATVDHGQMYMNAGEFVRNFYVPPPTEQEAFSAMQSNSGMTARERNWAGPLPQPEAI